MKERVHFLSRDSLFHSIFVPSLIHSFILCKNASSFLRFSVLFFSLKLLVFISFHLYYRGKNDKCMGQIKNKNGTLGTEKVERWQIFSACWWILGVVSFRHITADD